MRLVKSRALARAAWSRISRRRSPTVREPAALDDRIQEPVAELTTTPPACRSRKDPVWPTRTPLATCLPFLEIQGRLSSAEGRRIGYEHFARAVPVYIL